MATKATDYEFASQATSVRQLVTGARVALKRRDCSQALGYLGSARGELAVLREMLTAGSSDRAARFTALAARVDAAADRLTSRCLRKPSTGKAKRSRQKAGLGGLLAGALAGFIGGRLTKK